MNKSEEAQKKIQDFMNRVKSLEKNEKLDLSSGEDLSIAIMNLVSIEEHLFFSGEKTGDQKYFEILKEVRELRKTLLKQIIKESQGEVWCISKHLLAASMRLMEVGTKHLGKGQDKEANDLFAKSYQLYNLFWALNLKLVKLTDDKSLETENLRFLSDDPKKPAEKTGILSKFGVILNKILDCCRE